MREQGKKGAMVTRYEGENAKLRSGYRSRRCTEVRHREIVS